MVGDRCGKRVQVAVRDRLGAPEAFPAKYCGSSYTEVVVKIALMQCIFGKQNPQVLVIDMMEREETVITCIFYICTCVCIKPGRASSFRVHLAKEQSVVHFMGHRCFGFFFVSFKAAIKLMVHLKINDILYLRDHTSSLFYCYTQIRTKYICERQFYNKFYNQECTDVQ